MIDENWRSKLNSILNEESIESELENMTLNQLKDSVNEKYKEQPNFTPLTLKDMVNMSPEEISNLKNCL